jgi:hypothetical protein
MLTPVPPAPARRRPLLLVALLVLLLGLQPAARAEEDGTAWADGRERPGGGAEVTVGAATPGRPGSTGSTADTAAVRPACPAAPGGACTDDAGNWWHNGFGCYLVPAPDRVTAAEAAAHPDETPWRCRTAGDAASLLHWLPAGSGPGPDPAVLARQAVDSMRLQPAAVGATPLPGPESVSLIGLPTWLWVADPGPSTWGPLTATAAAGPVTVTATARVTAVVWDMGDGGSVTCAGPGTAWTPAMGAGDSPDCGYRYSGPGLRTITPTTAWQVQWSGGGRSGTMDLQVPGTARQVDVVERRAVITG